MWVPNQTLSNRFLWRAYTLYFVLFLNPVSCRDDQGRRKHVAYAEQKEDVARIILRWLEYTPIDRQAVEKYNCVIAGLFFSSPLYKIVGSTNLWYKTRWRVALAEKGAGEAGLYQKKDGDYFYLLGKIIGSRLIWFPLLKKIYWSPLVLHPVFGGKTAALTEDKAIQLMYDYLTSYYFGTGKQNAYTPKLSKEDFALWKEIVDSMKFTDIFYFAPYLSNFLWLAARYKYNSQILFKFIRDGTDIDCIMKSKILFGLILYFAKPDGTNIHLFKWLIIFPTIKLWSRELVHMHSVWL